MSPVDLSVEAPSPQLVDWFNESHCVVGLGDGIGMNYMTTSTEVAHSLISDQLSAG